MPDITYDVGRVSFVMKGAWNLATAYEKLDAVTHDGSLYIAKQDVPGGTAITNTTYWVLAVEKGDQGETGNGIASIAKTGTAGNVDTYTITYTDGTTTTFTVTNGGVTTVNGRTGDVTGLAEEDGNYPLLNAGTADNLTPYSEDSGATQDIPFINEATGGGNGESVVDTGSYLQFKKKLGNTVGVNQLINPANFASAPSPSGGVTFTNNGDGTVTAVVAAGGATETVYYQILDLRYDPSIVTGHKYFCFGGKDETQVYINFGGLVCGQATVYQAASGFGRIRLTIVSGTPAGTYVFKPKLVDGAIWFGSNDRIPSDLLSHPENWGRYYAGSLAYNAGTLESADGSVLTSIGRNVWDEEWENGYITATGAMGSNATSIRSKNYDVCIPNATYHCNNPAIINVCWYDNTKTFISRVDANGRTITAPSNAVYFKISAYGYGATYNNDITLSLYYEGESGYGTYYPFSVLAEVDTGSEVLRSAGAVADEKTPDGTITRRIGVVDMGTLTWSPNTISESVVVFDATPTDKAQTYNFRTAKYVTVEKNRAQLLNMEIGTWNTTNALNMIVIRDDSKSSMTGAQFAAAMSGVYLYYELATPTTEQGTAFAENIPCDDFGSLMWTQTKGIPQGNEIFYPVDYKASIDTLYKKVNGDMSKIVTEDEYPEAPSADGTYVLKATVSGGTKTYAWVTE